jgi:uroporphyrinogen III methyltransferase/synthase
VFSSSNGVRFVMDRLLAKVGDVRGLAGVSIAAIGSGTAEELARYHLRADLVPEEYRAEALAESLAKEAAGRRFLLARASRGREVLAERLASAGGVVDQVVVYWSTDVAEPDPEPRPWVADGSIGSPSPARQSPDRW